jgi:hypothetical protein
MKASLECAKSKTTKKHIKKISNIRNDEHDDKVY